MKYSNLFHIFASFSLVACAQPAAQNFKAGKTSSSAETIAASLNEGASAQQKLEVLRNVTFVQLHTAMVNAVTDEPVLIDEKIFSNLRSQTMALEEYYQDLNDKFGSY